MSSKQMSNWSLVWVLFVIAAILLEVFSGKGIDQVWFFMIMATIFNVGSSIMKQLENNT